MDNWEWENRGGYWFNQDTGERLTPQQLWDEHAKLLGKIAHLKTTLSKRLISGYMGDKTNEELWAIVGDAITETSPAWRAYEKIRSRAQHMQSNEDVDQLNEKISLLVEVLQAVPVSHKAQKKIDDWLDEMTLTKAQKPRNRIIFPYSRMT